MIKKLEVYSEALGRENAAIQVIQPEYAKVNDIIALLHGLVNPEGEFSLVENFLRSMDLERFAE